MTQPRHLGFCPDLVSASDARPASKSSAQNYAGQGPSGGFLRNGKQGVSTEHRDHSPRVSSATTEKANPDGAVKDYTLPLGIVIAGLAIAMLWSALSNRI